MMAFVGIVGGVVAWILGCVVLSMIFGTFRGDGGNERDRAADWAELRSRERTREKPSQRPRG